MQNSGTSSGRYAWTRVKSNRHKVNKRRDVSDAHLVGRLSLLELELEELGDRFPSISDKINAEIEMIRDEIALRASGKSKPSKKEAQEAPFEWEDFDSLAAMQDLTLLDGDNA